MAIVGGTSAIEQRECSAESETEPGGTSSLRPPCIARRFATFRFGHVDFAGARIDRKMRLGCWSVMQAKQGVDLPASVRVAGSTQPRSRRRQRSPSGHPRSSRASGNAAKTAAARENAPPGDMDLPYFVFACGGPMALSWWRFTRRTGRRRALAETIRSSNCCTRSQRREPTASESSTARMSG